MCRLVVVDRDAMPLDDWASLLSEREQAEVLTYTGTRRARTVTSRVLVKYLMSSPGGPDYRKLCADEIAAISRDELVSVETLSGSARQRTGAMVSKGGRQSSDQGVSAAHCGKYSAAGHSQGRLGIDLERIEPRRPEFYRQMFSADEREWVEELHGSASISSDAAFTLLWGVKESYLKASKWSSLSVWNFSRWSVQLGNDVAAILQPVRQEGAVSVMGRIASSDSGQNVDIIARRLEDMLLVSVQYGFDAEPGRRSL